MPNIINPNCLSLPQQVEKNKQDILKILASNLEELSGLQFIPNNLIYQNQQAVINGKFIVIRDETSIEIDGVVSIPFVGENGIVVDGSEDNLKIRIALDQSDRELFNYVQELVNRTTESDEIVFTSDMKNFVTEATDKMEEVETIYDVNSDDINLNWGYPSGIYNGTTINGKDFTKYKKLRLITGVFWSGRINRTAIVEISLEPNASNVNAGGSVVCSYFEGTFYNYLVECRLNTEKTSITFDAYRVTNNTNTSSGFVVLNKIEGVLK